MTGCKTLHFMLIKLFRKFGDAEMEMVELNSGNEKVHNAKATATAAVARLLARNCLGYWGGGGMRSLGVCVCVCVCVSTFARAVCFRSRRCEAQ